MTLYSYSYACYGGCVLYISIHLYIFLYILLVNIQLRYVYTNYVFVNLEKVHNSVCILASQYTNKVIYYDFFINRIQIVRITYIKNMNLYYQEPNYRNYKFIQIKQIIKIEETIFTNYNT